MMKKISSAFRRIVDVDAKFTVLGTLVTGLAIAFLIASTTKKVDLAFFIASPLLFFSAIMILVKEELPRSGMSSVKGFWAVVQGSLFLAMLIFPLIGCFL
jgi:hypothetical protein